MHQTRRRAHALWTLVMSALFITSLACSKAEQPQPEPKPAQAAPSEQPANPQKEAAPAPVAPESAKPPAAQTPAPAATPSASLPAAPAASPSSAPVTTPSPAVAPATPPPSSPAQQAPTAPPPAPVHAEVGSEKCKMCHRVQYDSWATSKHAAAGPPVTCETCHGNGADYASMSVMKDSAKARAAGLVMPGKEFCTAKCHKAAAFTDDMLQKAHAHKVK